MIYNIAFTLREKESDTDRNLIFNLGRNLDHLHKDDDLLLEYFDPQSSRRATKIRLIYIRKNQEFFRGQKESVVTYFFFLSLAGLRDRNVLNKTKFSKTEIDNTEESLTQFCLDQDF